MRNYRGKRKDNGEEVKGWYFHQKESHFILPLGFMADSTRCEVTNYSETATAEIRSDCMEVIPETVEIEVCGQWFNEKELSDIVKKGLDVVPVCRKYHTKLHIHDNPELL